MSKPIRILTGGLLLMPLVMLVFAFKVPPLALIALGEAAIFAAVWFWFRPSRFEIGPDAITITWPLRHRRYPLAEMTTVRELPAGAFRREYGWGARVGSGGLWGAFGQLWTPKARLHMYVSRTDRFVVVTRSGGLPLMLTPEDPARFVAELAARIG